MRLQDAWTTYGAGAFSFGVLDYVDDVLELDPTEQQWLDVLQPAYNTRRRADSAPRRRHNPTDAARFWSGMDRSGGPDSCWLWLRGTSYGYGVARWAGRSCRAHRLAWILTNGPVPDSLLVLHDCDRRYTVGDHAYRRCCNPAHLFLGTHAQNTADMMAKGRHRSGRVGGDAHWMRQHPERIRRGAESWAAQHPERLARGERQGRAKLTTEQVREMRAAAASRTMTNVEIAGNYGVSPVLVGLIIRRLAWTHVEDTAGDEIAPSFLTTAEVMQRLDLSASRIGALARCGILPVHHVGLRHLFAIADVQALLQKRGGPGPQHKGWPRGKPRKADKHSD